MTSYVVVGQETGSLSPTADGSVNWYKLNKAIQQFITKQQMYNSSDPAIPLLGIYSTNTLWKDSLKKLLILALFVKNQG